MPPSSLGWEGPAADVPGIPLPFISCKYMLIANHPICQRLCDHPGTHSGASKARLLSNPSPLGFSIPREEGSWQPVSSAGQVSLQRLFEILSAFAATQLVFLECLLEWGLLHRGLPSGSLQSRGPGPPNSMPSSVKKRGGGSQKCGEEEIYMLPHQTGSYCQGRVISESTQSLPLTRSSETRPPHPNPDASRPSRAGGPMVSPGPGYKCFTRYSTNIY